MGLSPYHSIATASSVTALYLLLFFLMLLPKASTPWNKGRCVGARSALSPNEVQKLLDLFRQKKASHDQCLFMMAIDSMLRCSDLLALKVGDIVHQDGGDVRDSFSVRQKKTQQAVVPRLTLGTQQACEEWIQASNKTSDHYLFTRNKRSNNQPISSGYYRTLIKHWVSLIHLDHQDFSSHSLRRTKPIFLYKQGVAVEDIAQLLGHKDTRTTIRYLGLNIEKAHQQALAHDIFNAQDKPSTTTQALPLSDQQLAELAKKIVVLMSDFYPEKFDRNPQND